MKTLVLTLFLCITSITSFGQTKPSKLIASCESRGCSGSEYCSACKNCSGCKHCAKEGGTCGVCAPPQPKKKAVTKSSKTKKKLKTKKAS